MASNLVKDYPQMSFILWHRTYFYDMLIWLVLFGVEGLLSEATSLFPFQFEGLCFD